MTAPQAETPKAIEPNTLNHVLSQPADVGRQNCRSRNNGITAIPALIRKATEPAAFGTQT